MTQFQETTAREAKKYSCNLGIVKAEDVYTAGRNSARETVIILAGAIEKAANILGEQKVGNPPLKAWEDPYVILRNVIQSVKAGGNWPLEQ